MVATAFGCELVELLHEGERSAIYRARRRGGNASVVLKTAGTRSSPERVRLLQHEWQMLRQLQQAEGVVRAHALERDGDQWCLVLEDTQAVSLDRLARAERLSLVDVLSVSLGIVEALQAVHQMRLIHADLQPSNIVSSGSSRRITLIDFSSAARWGGETARSRKLSALAYTSPEQTGRVNRSVDHRTDFYSFGVILYELLVGVVPFDQTEPLELVHAHVARQPRSPAEVQPGLPHALVEIVLKLLAKDAEDRYQSAVGLRTDLLRCREEILAGSGGVDFEIAKFDRPEYFRLPRRLYGRNAQIERLTACFDTACGGAARVLAVAGAPGVGKSATIAQLAGPVAAKRGYFASGKFEQYESGVPYVAFSRVLDALVHQILAGSSDELSLWRSRLLAILSDSAAVLIDLCPALEQVLGRQAPAPRLPVREAQTRLQHALSTFFDVLATAERPLCIVFDDVHWADVDSVNLLKELVLAGRELPALIIVAYRDGEIGDRHPLRAALGLISEQGIVVEQLLLDSISDADVAQLIRDATAVASSPAAELAELVVARTGGNPFFVRSFLDSLDSDGLLELGPDGWAFHLDRIRQRGITDNIVDLLVDRIRRLPLATQELLQLAACVGNRFDLETLDTVAGRSTVDDLSPAIAAELVLSLDLAASTGTFAAARERSYQFTHDRVQQAVLSVLTQPARRERHLQAGRRLWASSSGELRSRRLFEIVGQLNQAAELLEGVEREELARLNLQAAQAALQGAAGAEALQLARAGLSALSATRWSEQYEMTRDLHLAGAEAAFVVADHEAMEAFARETLRNIRSPLDAVRMRMLQGLVCFGASRFREAMVIYLQALAELGVAIPIEPTAEQVAEEVRLTAAVLRGKAVSELLELPKCHDPRICLSAELLSKVILLAGSMTDPIMPVAACRLVSLSLEHGNTAESANAYTFYGQFSSAEDLERAYEFGKLALGVCHRFEDRAVRSQTYIYAYYQLMHWRAPFSELVEGLRTALRYGLEAASPFNAACSATTLCIARFWSGEPLSQLGADLDKYHQLVVRFRQGLVLNWHEIWQQVVSNLRLDPAAPTELGGPSYDEGARVKAHLAAGDGSALFNYYVGKAMLCYTLGDYQTALRCMDDNQPLSALFATQFWAFPVAFLDSLCRLAGCAGAEPGRREELLSQVQKTLQKMLLWLPHNRGILKHKVRLLQAELASVCGDGPAAQRLFAEAVQLAAEAGILHEEALGCELAARCSFHEGDRDAARTYLRAAHRAYLKWGALAKVRALEREFPGLLPRVTTGSVNVLAVAGLEYEFDPLDLVSLIDAGQVISSEIKLDRLLRQLLRLLIESAGAQAVYLLMPQGNNWVVQAGQSSELGLITLLEAISLEDPRTASLGILPSVVNYVTRTGEAVLLDDVAHSTLFGQGQVVPRVGAASLACFGLKRRGQILAVAYLENRLVRGAFTPKGQRMLEALSTQAVTSLENAMLYAQLEQKVEARTRELVQKNEELTSALVRLTEMREQLVTQEKLAALGALTAGIAHEIKNPLNFVTNFALVSSTLVQEIQQHLLSEPRAGKRALLEAQRLLEDLGQAVQKVNEHGSRASGIVSGMALHARESGGPREHADLNEVLARSVQLSSETRRNGMAHIAIDADYDAGVGSVEFVVQDISRVFVNIINNACYSVELKRSKLGAGFVPRLSIGTRDLGQRVEVRIRDNGTGIPTLSKDKIFLPFFTTKAPREGTGLGLSISHDIVVRAHGGELRVESLEGEFAEFILVLPRRFRLLGPAASSGFV